MITYVGLKLKPLRERIDKRINELYRQLGKNKLEASMCQAPKSKIARPRSLKKLSAASKPKQVRARKVNKSNKRNHKKLTVDDILLKFDEEEELFERHKTFL